LPKKKRLAQKVKDLWFFAALAILLLIGIVVLS